MISSNAVLANVWRNANSLPSNFPDIYRVMMAGCSFREIDRAYAEIAKIQKHWSESVENWEVLTTIGLDKTYHPSKLFPAAPRTTPPPAREKRRSRPFTPRLDREWEHDAANISMANALA
jgi:hypothetical protein